MTNNNPTARLAAVADLHNTAGSHIVTVQQDLNDVSEYLTHLQVALIEMQTHGVSDYSMDVTTKQVLRDTNRLLRNLVTDAVAMQGHIAALAAANL